jgi:hypothetical protein
MFFVTAALLGAALLALRWISWREIDPKRAHGGPPEPGARTLQADLLNSCAAASDHLRRLHHAVPSRQCRDASADGRRVGNPFEPMGDDLDRGMHRWAATRRRTLLSLDWAEGPDMGRRPPLLAAFASLPLRGLLFATVTNPYLLVATQLLDGIAAAVHAAMVRSSSLTSRAAPGISISDRGSSAPRSESALRSARPTQAI